MTDEKRIPLADELEKAAKEIADRLASELNMACDPQKNLEGLSAALLRQTVEALENMKGMYDTPIERRRKGACKVYAETISTARAALKAAYGEDKS